MVPSIRNVDQESLSMMYRILIFICRVVSNEALENSVIRERLKADHRASGKSDAGLMEGASGL